MIIISINSNTSVLQADEQFNNITSTSVIIEMITLSSYRAYSKGLTLTKQAQ